MDGTISEIRMFAPPFAPRNWAMCMGQTLNISTNQALFSLLGTTYGGNGVQTFMLPDMRSRVPVGTGVTSGIIQMPLGAVVGQENVTLLLSNMPIHNHVGSLGGSGKLLVSSAAASSATPVAGASIASPVKATGRSSTQLLGFKNNAQPTVALNNASLNTSPLTVTSAQAGSGQPHSNIQPYLGINYIICLQGIYPSRN
ncbi:phage tail protein [Pedobacter xixiisoli]|uniref:Microcystin-dependent protein n=1 Tax=Pedobacter xixiisoli TaxID=1476464 RepID=A0A285ZUP3_9SPHI|nr:tail fiber protein [Pedobacter xixiisoli]SOD13373.1 Microcystin-dependent protein [Pedobacter xixiisoli]